MLLCMHIPIYIYVYIYAHGTIAKFHFPFLSTKEKDEKDGIGIGSVRIFFIRSKRTPLRPPNFIPLDARFSLVGRLLKISQESIVRLSKEKEEIVPRCAIFQSDG